MTNKNLYSFLSSGFPTDKSKPAMISPNGATISYADLEILSAQIAQLLTAKGATSGTRVMVQVEKSPVAVALYLACLRAGATYIPLNTAYTPSELSYFMEDSQPTVIVCDPSGQATLLEISKTHGVPHLFTLDNFGEGTLLDQAKGFDGEQTPTEVEDDDIAATLYTSGTTGKPKGAMLSHKNLVSNAQVLHSLWGFHKGDVLLHALPIFHVHGLFVALHLALHNGSTMFFHPKFDAGQVIRDLPQSTVMMGVPTFYTRLLSHPDFNAEVSKSIRLFISGSAPLLAETFSSFEQRTGQRILERYGMTEAGMITSNPLDGERIAATVGYPLDGVVARLSTEDGKEGDGDTIGGLEIKGPNVFLGYWRKPEKTAEEFTEDGYFKTGDLATIAADGRVAIVGRSKDLIISGGYNIYPKEIEGHIDDIKGVGETAVIGIAHNDFGEGVVAVITRDPTQDQDDLDQDAIIAQLSDKIARFKQPKRIYFVDTLPRNTMGKVQKNVLRDTYADCFK